MSGAFKQLTDVTHAPHDSDAPGVGYKLWLGRVVGWDGLLPIFVSAAAVCVALLFPRHQGVQTIALLALPIAGFFWRARIGRRQICGNFCGVWTRRAQFVALGVALLMLVFFDFFAVLVAFLPKGRRQPPPEDVPIWAGIIGAYLLLAMFAMYPGRGLTSADR